MNKAGTFIAILFVLVSLGILALSFVGNTKSIPPQDNGTHTGYPVWHPPLPGYNEQVQDATILFSAIMLTISGYFAYKWTIFNTQKNAKVLTYFVDRESIKTSTITFDRLLAVYSFVTALAGILYFAVDVGKMWAIIGIFHNVVEVCILVTLHQGGRITSNSFVIWITLYVLLAVSLSIFLEWPFDALWFKVQGLCSDYALVIQFTRMYFNTRKGYGDETYQRLLDIENPRQNHTNRESISSEIEEIDQTYQINDDFGSIGYFRPQYVLFLVLASLTHLFGNDLTTILVYEFDSYVIFSFTYSVAFPAYAYFVYLDTHTVAVSPAQKYIILPDTSILKVILVTLSTIFLSLLTARIGLIVQ
ncbi:1655_t:CDS:1 [Funneliformis geosporum]|uniref:8628_t:CDS:1 n=1 Tax=Funneliformis geosporum TaxID=1117311 RepID=A0A9W4SPF3_9GLOM|nr:1655_t:CDS:1 [Funneliformis geosporum]CAI2176752.1 8628_t:CDS:1 [Funneliformis geosporum]